MKDYFENMQGIWKINFTLHSFSGGSNLESSKLTRKLQSPVFLMMPSSVCITQLLNSVTAPNPPAFVASSHLFAWIRWNNATRKACYTRKNAPGPRVNAAWFFWPDHISRWSTKIISKFSLKLMQKTSFNKKIQKKSRRLHHQHLPTFGATNISNDFFPPDAPGLRHLDQKVALPRSSAITRHQGPTPVALGCAPSCCETT